MTEISLPEKLEPLFRPARYKVVHGGRGGGKSWGVARILVILARQRKLRILCARETQKSIAESVHRLLVDQLKAVGLESFYTVQETTIIGQNGSEFVFAGLRQQGVDNIKSFEGVDIVWVEEGQAVTRKSWDVLIPTIRKAGSEIWVTFNPELETDETYDRFVTNKPDGAIVIEMNWQDNPWFPAELEAERLNFKRRDPEGYLTIWEGKCRPAVSGAIYLNEIRGMNEGKRLTNVPYDPTLKVHCAWDLGWNDAMTIVMFQRGVSEIRVIDYIEDSHKRLDEYVLELKERRYNWGKDYLPHDGFTKDFKSGKSAKDILTSLGRDVEATPNVKVEQGIRAARLVFPRVYFDKTKAGRLVECLKRYRRAVNQATGEAGSPLHDEFSHGADAFRYMALVVDIADNDDWSDDGQSHNAYDEDMA